MDSTSTASETPVMFLSVTSNAVTSPAATGSETAAKTIGIVSVWEAATCAAPVPIGMIMSTFSETRLEKIEGRRDASLDAFLSIISLLESS